MTTYRIDAGTLIPGSGPAIPGGVVITSGSTIGYAGPAADAPPTPGATTITARTVMPGMWDCHGHFLGITAMDLAKLPMEPLAVRTARATADLRAALDAGFTSVREVGGVGIHLAPIIAEGTLPGPAIYAAGAILSTTGGHGDLHALPLDWVSHFGHHGGELRLCDGTAECMRAVREQLRRNAKLIKVCASGGAFSEVDHPMHQQFTTAELRTIVEVAGLAERAVAAHCHGKPAIMAALEAGVLTIEHGTYLDDEACAAMKEAGAILVPTLTILSELLATPDSVPPYALAKLRASRDRHAEAIALAHQHGVTIACGTDIALSGIDTPNGWGRNGIELELMVRTGLTPAQAIEAATATAPLTLGPQAPLSGQLRAGYDADILTLDIDPLTDIGALADPRHITRVWKSGELVKDIARE
ncbi:amidohydrolase family protein [Nocardia sp. NPDC056100]|uniref:metal-dependent hydrolase family protein n=1 Tax=Nocardia sp. NPDC056100 TaxID=3345712 RepID=UPI0035DE545C